MFEWHQQVSQGWYLAALSSLLCVLGCLIIFTDDVYELLFPRALTRRYPFKLKQNYGFMNGSLAFSSGCLFLTALYRLLPEASSYLEKNRVLKHQNITAVLIASFIGGILTCVMFNQGLHLLTNESVVHCSHDGEDKMELIPSNRLSLHRTHSHTHSSHDHESAPNVHTHSHHNHPHSEDHTHSHTAAQESTPLLQKSPNGHPAQHDSTQTNDISLDSVNGPEESDLGVQDYFSPETPGQGALEATEHPAKDATPHLARKESTGIFYYLAHGSDVDETILGECKGFLSAERCLYDSKNQLHYCEIPVLRQGAEVEAADEDRTSLCSSHDHARHMTDEHHHHHVNSPLSRLLLIGIQTVFAITLHKLPEGFITYVTSETNPELGVSIFLSLLIHNYTEGFLMCLPLYYSFGNGYSSKWKAVGISATLGGLSQPLGALMGYFFIHHYQGDGFDVNRLNSVFGVSMAVTSGFLAVIALLMYGSAVSFSGLPNFVLIWCLIGMCTIGVLTVFTSD